MRTRWSSIRTIRRTAVFLDQRSRSRTMSSLHVISSTSGHFPREALTITGSPTRDDLVRAAGRADRGADCRCAPRHRCPGRSASSAARNEAQGSARCAAGSDRRRARPARRPSDHQGASGGDTGGVRAVSRRGQRHRPARLGAARAAPCRRAGRCHGQFDGRAWMPSRSVCRHSSSAFPTICPHSSPTARCSAPVVPAPLPKRSTVSFTTTVSVVISCAAARRSSAGRAFAGTPRRILRWPSWR